MKKLTLVAAAVALGFLGLNANAKLLSGSESVKVKATVLVQNGDKVAKHKLTSDDILYLIDIEYGTSYSKYDGGKGYQLVSYGVGYDSGDDDIFAVADKDGTIVLDDASFNADDYYLYLTPSYSGDYVATVNGANYNYTVGDVSVYYNSADDNDSFSMNGIMTDKVNWDTYKESYSLKNAGGSIDFGDVLDQYGTSFSGLITGGSVSGTGMGRLSV